MPSRIDSDSGGFLGYARSGGGGSTGSPGRDFAIKLARLYNRDRWLFSPRRLGPRVDGVPLDRPIFLLGTQGCGGTLIGRCLRRNRNVVTVSGGHQNWTGIDELGIVRNRTARLPSSLWGTSERSDLAHPSFGAVHASAFASSELLPLYRGTAEDAADGDAERFRRLLREHIAVFAPDPASARFLDKTHAYSVKMPLISSLLDGAGPLFVLVVRNPYFACRWAVERKPPDFRRGLSRDERLRLVAEHWAKMHRIALDDAASIPNVTVVRLEDFLAQPEAVVRSLCAFTGLEYDPALVPRPGQKRPWATLPGDRKWYPLYVDDRLGRPTAADTAIIGERCLALAERFGYSPDGSAAGSGTVELLAG